MQNPQHETSSCSVDPCAVPLFVLWVLQNAVKQTQTEVFSGRFLLGTSSSREPDGLVTEAPSLEVSSDSAMQGD